MTSLDTKIQYQLGALLLANLKQSQIVEELQLQLKQAVDGNAEVVTGLENRLLEKLADEYDPKAIQEEAEGCSQ